MNHPLADSRTAMLARLEEELLARLPYSSLEAGKRLNEALQYELGSGGKRIRPLLTLVSAELFAVPEEIALRLGCAIEYLHLA
ncbi:MAG: polyprenyl synthetase family protein, partial [Bryobacterales bacterium]|nr:polyprenyl synthetase family protein [Bryobacteraceae bacterium]MDW8131868.1 polyprenyl synthetase family protein [Bryobacterales bacterium]